MASSFRTVALAALAAGCARWVTAQETPAASPPAAPSRAVQPVPAAPPGADSLLETLVGEALRANPDLLALEEALTAARARPDQARSLSDPMLSVVYTNDGWSPSLGTMSMTTLAFMGSQELPWPGKRGLRGDVAAREADLLEQQLERARLGTAAAVTRAYHGMVLSRALLGLIGEQEQLWKQIEGVARARYAVGQGAQPDVLRAQIEVTRIEERRAEQEAESRIRRAELNRLTGRPAGTEVETAARLALASHAEDVERTVERLAGMSPELKGAAAAQERAALRLALAGKEYKPDFSVQAGYMNRGGLDPMWQAGVGVSLPLYRKRLAGGRAEAEADVRASARLAEAVRLQLRFRTEERIAQLQATERIAALYEHGVIPQARMAVDAAVANYQSGKVPFVAVLEAMATLHNDRATYLGLLANHARIRASVEEASLEATSSLGAGGAAMSPGAGSAMSSASSGTPGAAMGSGRSMP